jgi:hypothetical protein
MILFSYAEELADFEHVFLLYKIALDIQEEPLSRLFLWSKVDKFLKFNTNRISTYQLIFFEMLSLHLMHPERLFQEIQFL